MISFHLLLLQRILISIKGILFFVNSLLHNVIYETMSRNADFKDPTMVQDRHTFYTKRMVWCKTCSECLMLEKYDTLTC
jgi:hypothetical protein